MASVYVLCLLHMLCLLLHLAYYLYYYNSVIYVIYVYVISMYTRRIFEAIDSEDNTLTTLTTTSASLETSKITVEKEVSIHEVITSNPRIDFNNVSFQYRTRNVPVFENMSLSIPAKTITAIAGRSGAGIL